jgi:hypothetical protein
VDSEADPLPLGGPWDCMLRVQGVLALDGAALLGGLQLTPAGGAGGAAATELRGVLSGPDAVAGALAPLHALGYALRRVTGTPRRCPTGGRADRPGG